MPDAGVPFSISVDVTSGTMRLYLQGLLTTADVADFARQQRAASASLRSHGGTCLTLCDVTECKIQAQEVVERFRTLLRHLCLRSRRIAFVTGASPAKMQVRRLIDRDAAGFFETHAEAEAWLHRPAEQDGPGGA